MKYIDEDTSSEYDDEKICQQSFVIRDVDFKFVNNLNKHIFSNVKTYDFKDWKTYFSKDDINIVSLLHRSSWQEFIDMISTSFVVDNINTKLKKELKDKKKILPYPELLFNTFNILSPNQINVVIIGQDPYINISEDLGIPEAHGFAFSTPYNYNKNLPPTSQNIFKNMISYGHMKKKPNGNCLVPWALQGCLLLNTALTTVHKKSNAHEEIWEEFTKKLIIYLSTTFKNLIFVAWGNNAHKLCLNVDIRKHYIITSSHPSPLACTRTLNGSTYHIEPSKRKKCVYPSFNSVDHFGKINEYLQIAHKRQIYWDLIY